jgi:transcription antitermination factor NusG
VTGWVVVLTKPNCENIAVANLTQQGFSCYAPRYKQLRPDKTVIIKPLFPRYIFTLISDKWYCIRGTRGVSYLLMGDTGPCQVPISIIEKIKSREDSEGFIMLEQKLIGSPTFKKGDKVKVTEGPLLDKLLIYDGVTSNDRVRVLISMLGREVPAIIKEKSLVAA